MRSGEGEHAPIAHVVLVEPEIPWNTGNAGRTCLALGAKLHLVGPLGFSLDEKAVRRAGLDYWQHVQPSVSPSWASFAATVLGPLGTEPWIVTPDGRLSPWAADLGTCPVLVFGAESSGLPIELRSAYAHRSLQIPMRRGPVRSLNVSTTVAVILYEVVRRNASRAGGIAGAQISKG